MKEFIKNFVSVGFMVLVFFIYFSYIKYPVYLDKTFLFLSFSLFGTVFTIYKFKDIVRLTRIFGSFSNSVFIVSLLGYVGLLCSKDMFAYFAKLHLYQMLQSLFFPLVILAGIIFFVTHQPKREKTLDDEVQSKRKKLIHILSLLTIIIVYLIIRLPYFNNTFYITLHPGKYTSYIPTSQEMYRNGNPFVFKNQAYTGVFESVEEQDFGSFWRMPILEWTLAPFFILEKVLSTEAIVRTHLTLLGIFILTCLYTLLKKIFSPWVGFVITFLFSLTPVFNLLTWTTTLDLPAFAFLLLSLNLYFYKRKDLAFLMLGFAYLTKLSFIIIGFPLFFLLILSGEKDKIVKTIKLFLLSFLPLGLFKLFLESTPLQPFFLGRNISLMFLFVACILLSYLLIHNKLQQLLEKIQNKSFFWYINFTVIIIAFLFAIAFILRKSFLGLSGEFLTDLKLAFNPDFYKVLIERIRFMSNPIMNTLFLFSMVAAWFLPRKKRGLLFSFILTSLVFLVITSKSIRFAWYYNHFFVLTIYLFVGGLLHQLEKRFALKPYSAKIFFIAVVAVVSLQLAPKPDYVLGNKMTPQDVENLSEIIKSTTNPGDKVISFFSEHRVLYLYTDRPFILLGSITNLVELERLRNEITELGFYEAMSKHNIKLMIKAKEQQDFKPLVYLFTNEVNKTSHERTDSILAGIYDEVEYYEEVVGEIEENINIQQYFTEIGTVGDITVYKIVPTEKETLQSISESGMP